MSSIFNFEQFKKDLKTGQEWEKKAQMALIEYFNNKYSVIEECNNKNYDFKLSNGIKYEVKLNKQCNKYKCVFIEFEAFGKPSGIITTQADYYVLAYPIEDNKPAFIIIDILDIELIITNKEYKNISITSTSKGYIIDINIIFKYSVFNIPNLN